MLFILASNEGMHKSLDEFEYRPDITTDYGLAALGRLKNRCHHFLSVAFDPNLFNLAGNEDMHNILDEFEFRPDMTTDYAVSCP